MFDNIGIPHFKNVSKIELKGISFPKVENEDYVCLKLNDLNTSFWTSDGSCQQSDLFSIIYFDSSALPTGTRKPGKGADFYQKVVQFDSVIYLTHVHVQFSLYNGEKITLDKTNGVSDHTLILEITHS
jgi:hypothetical protein